MVELNYCNNSKKKKEKRRTRREKRRKEEKKGRKRKGKEGKREERFREQEQCVKQSFRVSYRPLNLGGVVGGSAQRPPEALRRSRNFFFSYLVAISFPIEFDVWGRLCTHFEAAKVRR